MSWTGRAVAGKVLAYRTPSYTLTHTEALLLMSAQRGRSLFR